MITSCELFMKYINKNIELSLQANVKNTEIENSLLGAFYVFL